MESPPQPPDLGFERTRLAYERTMMAWIRTAASLISFGFSVDKFFGYLSERGTVAHTDRLFGPREFAITMIAVGLLSLGLAIVEQRRSLATLEQAGYGPRRHSLSMITAALVALLGIAGLSAVVWPG